MGSASYGGSKPQYNQKVNKELDLFWGEQSIEMTTAVRYEKYRASKWHVSRPILTVFEKKKKKNKL